MATMTIDSLAVLAMSGLFAVFLGAMWWEARRVLQELADNERVSIKWESEAAFRREMAREQARYRLNQMRVANVSALPQADEADAMGPEHIGRILERLAQIETSMEPEWERVPELNFVRGGQTISFESEAVAEAPVVAPRKSGKRRGAPVAPIPFDEASGVRRHRANKTQPALLATATR